MASQATAVSLGSVNERRLRPVYEHLDIGNNKSALHEAEKVLKKQKDLSAAKVLKVIALNRLGRRDEAFALSQEVAALGPTDENSLQGLSLYYRETHRHDLIPPIYESAVSKCVGNEEYLTHLFMSYVRTEKPKDMQRVAILLYKHHPKNPYLFWGIMAIVMQALNDEKLGKMMFLPLAERMIEKHIEKGKIEAEAEVRLYLIVLEMLEKHEKCLEVLEGKHARYFMLEGEEISILKTNIYKKLGKWEKINSRNKVLLKKEPDTWNHVIGYLDSLEHLVDNESKEENSNADDAGTSFEDADHKWEQAVDLFLQLLESERSSNAKRTRRGPFLAVLELHKRLKLMTEKDESISTLLERTGNPVELIIEFVELFSSKPCCFGDLEPYVKSLESEEKNELLLKINEKVLSFILNENETDETENDDKLKEKKIQEHLFYLEMQRFLGHHEALKKADKIEVVTDLLKRYDQGLKHSSYRPVTDVRVVDDYLLLAANIMIDLYKEEDDLEHLWKAIYILELGKQRSTINFRIKFTLIRLYCEIGIFMPCAQIYDSLDIKHMQQDTLGYIVCHAVSSFGHYQLASQAFEASRAFFISNNKDSLELLIACFRNGTFHKVSEFISFRNHVKDSLHSALTTTEHTYMDLVTQGDLDIPYYDLIETCCLPDERFNFEILTDNRDFSIRFDWMPEHKQLKKSHTDVSFTLEKHWLRFRELQVRSILELLKLASQSKTLGDSGLETMNSFLKELEEIVENTKYDPGISVEFPFHGPPRSRIQLLLEVKYQDTTVTLLRLFHKLLAEIINPESEKDLKKVSESLISGIEDALSLAGLTAMGDTLPNATKKSNKKKTVKHDHCHGDCDHDDNDSVCVTSSPEKTVESAVNLIVPNSLKDVKRCKLERLVATCELFSLTVLLTNNFSSLITEVRSEAIKKRRRKKGKQAPMPSIITFYQEFVSELKNLGQKLLSAIEQMSADAETMTLDLSKMDGVKVEKEKLANGEVEPMQQCNGETEKTTPTTTPLPDQLVQLASDSILNSTNQLSEIIQGRLGNLKAIKV
uniref:N-alpha-acetyltransferase 25, NatB auxiliary subunit-like isoform X1 n=1 Tax=Styela clava TaxID=7725 RepID=UPI00193A03A4|nr:N-alpha-acetyltransferase 25, NatB auxiliary subunit-like isoform X1 [Styela clava]XP_039257887.1 N-alpha-acetyltransferase 25, NatB auxiliary subunit-like isoform X2 [Styela clava]